MLLPPNAILFPRWPGDGGEAICRTSGCRRRARSRIGLRGFAHVLDALRVDDLYVALGRVERVCAIVARVEDLWFLLVDVRLWGAGPDTSLRGDGARCACLREGRGVG